MLQIRRGPGDGCDVLSGPAEVIGLEQANKSRGIISL